MSELVKQQPASKMRLAAVLSVGVSRILELGRNACFLKNLIHEIL